jgi:Fe2+ transport system protein B
MNKIEELEKILITDVLIEVEEEIKGLKKLISKQNNNNELQDELSYMEDVKKYYDEVLAFIKKGLLKEDEAIKILADLEDMRADDEDEV